MGRVIGWREGVMSGGGGRLERRGGGSPSWGSQSGVGEMAKRGG